ncbi:esterase/lipase family protein [Streptomyces sp. NBC_00887]|uniref:esterase/lipase family protein n=1 Tax=Streptomyces sp. NBC_00887 TaxID=2975859 RepID=UPI00386E9D76|nr:GPI inositol-deacylase [Streptomyces sp. NBC_00887]WSY36127.1 GPI inositol-deacylase [Streptomyces sp. NBC_00887]
MRLRSSLVTSVVSAAVLLTMTPAASAATSSEAETSAAREDSKQRPVFFIKGYTPGHTCGEKWNSAATLFKKSKWEGTLHRVGFYEEDDEEDAENGGIGCDVRIDPEGKGTVDTSLKDLGRGLAWKIHDMYSSKGQTVDVVGHSMGGLIARAALAGYEKGDPTWPPVLLVEDVVNLGTPQKAALFAALCSSNLQCREMRYPNGTFRRWLGPTLPQAKGGTDWTLIGSNADGTVGAGNAAPTDVGAQHLVRYSESSGLDHTKLRTKRAGTFPLRYTNNGGAWGSLPQGAAPLRATMNALYWHSRW